MKKLCGDTCGDLKRRVAIFWIVLFGATAMTPEPGITAPPPPSDKEEGARALPVREVELRGRIVCLSEEMHRLYDAHLPSDHEHLYGLKSTDGSFYTLLRTKWSEALFRDARLRERELLLKGRLFPQTHILDLTRLRSFREGKVCDVYYYCDVCSVKSVAPGPCICCRAPVELVEEPLAGNP
jgi:hypothetical protein